MTQPVTRTAGGALPTQSADGAFELAELET